MKTKNLRKRRKTLAISRRLPDKARAENGKAPQVAADQQVDEVERTFSIHWEW